MSLRCALYTRKSTEEGLEKAFNSLDAQREACVAFIRSQTSLGWRVISKTYDDGGPMERPALQQLLTDIEAGRVEIVVVYKIHGSARDAAIIIVLFDLLPSQACLRQDIGGTGFALSIKGVGRASGGYTELLSGIKVGERIVVAGNFLIDSESNLRASLNEFNTGGAKQ